MKNFTIPENEKPLYYSSTIENGVVVKHDGDPEHAVYSSVITEIQRRAKLWHKWLTENVPDAYTDWGTVNDDVMAKYNPVRIEFMNGERSK